MLEPRRVACKVGPREQIIVRLFIKDLLGGLHLYAVGDLRAPAAFLTPRPLAVHLIAPPPGRWLVLFVAEESHPRDLHCLSTRPVHKSWHVFFDPIQHPGTLVLRHEVVLEIHHHQTRLVPAEGPRRRYQIASRLGVSPLASLYRKVRGNPP